MTRARETLSSRYTKSSLSPLYPYNTRAPFLRLITPDWYLLKTERGSHIAPIAYPLISLSLSLSGSLHENRAYPYTQRTIAHAAHRQMVRRISYKKTSSSSWISAARCPGGGAPTRNRGSRASLSSKEMAGIYKKGGRERPRKKQQVPSFVWRFTRLNIPSYVFFLYSRSFIFAVRGHSAREWKNNARFGGIYSREKEGGLRGPTATYPHRIA